VDEHSESGVGPPFHPQGLLGIRLLGELGHRDLRNRRQDHGQDQEFQGFCFHCSTLVFDFGSTSVIRFRSRYHHGRGTIKKEFVAWLWNMFDNKEDNLNNRQFLDVTMTNLAIIIGF
jgi:hypothetical protein